MITLLHIYIYISNIQLVRCVMVYVMVCVITVITLSWVIIRLHGLHTGLHTGLYTYYVVNQLVMFVFDIMCNEIGEGGL